MGKSTIIEAQNSNTIYEDGKVKGTLGVLKGIFADYKNGTRNGDRLYNEELWDNRVFGSEDVMEALETKTLFGELDHPEGDRCETLAQNAAITITKLEKKPEEGVIYGEAEILDTPTGRIVKALADSGARLGISSRGMGEEIYENGQNIIDPDTYDFITFDVVVTPANTKARVALSESKHMDKLTESIKKEILASTTDNQLNQIKTVVESMNVQNKEDLLNIVESKLHKEEDSKPSLTEANKSIAIKLLNNKLENINESLETLKQENNKLQEEKEFLEQSRKTIQSKLKECLAEHNETLNQLNECKNQIEESDIAHKDILNKIRKINNKKLENLNKEKEELINKEKENTQKIEEELNKLKEENEKLTENVKEQGKILVENKQLKEQIENLNKEKVNMNTKLTESKKIEESKILTLENRIKELEKTNKELTESKERLSTLSFNTIGTVEAVNKKNTNYSQEDQELFDLLTNKR